MGNSESLSFYEEHKIPPNEKLTKEYQISTDFGKADPKSKNINAASQLPIENQKFTLMTKPAEFSINGEGYSLFYKITKYGIFGLVFCLVPLTYALMLIYHSGDDCGKDLKEIPTERILGDQMEKGVSRLGNRIEKYFESKKLFLIFF